MIVALLVVIRNYVLASLTNIETISIHAIIILTDREFTMTDLAEM